MTTIKFVFDWNIYQPDQRTYRQNSVQLFPVEAKVEIEVPRESEYIANLEDIIQAEIGNGGKPVPKPILTVKGLRYITDQFDEIFYKTEIGQEDGPGTSKDDDWEEGDHPNAVNKDDWGEEWPEQSAEAPTPVAVGPQIDEWAEAAADEKWDDTKEDWG